MTSNFNVEDKITSKSEKNDEKLDSSLLDEFNLRVPKQQYSYLLQDKDDTIEISYQDVMPEEQEKESEYEIEIELSPLRTQSSVLTLEIPSTQKKVEYKIFYDAISLSIIIFYVVDQIRVYCKQGDGKVVFTNFVTVLLFYISIWHLIESYKRKTPQKENERKMSNSSLDYNSISQAEQSFSKNDQSINIGETSTVL